MKRFSRILAALLIAVLCLSIPTALADGKVTTTGREHLRSGPGLDYAKLDTVPKGTKLTYTKTAKDERGVTWYRVTYDGQRGWISSKYAQKGGSGGGSSKSGKVTTSGRVNMRSGAGLDYRALAVIEAGVTMNYDRTSKDERGVTWYRVSYRGQKGWISSKYASRSGGGTSGAKVCSTASTNVRTGPGLFYGVIGSLTSGQSVTYLDVTRWDDRGVAWYKVSFRGSTGWVSSRYTYIA